MRDALHDESDDFPSEDDHYDFGDLSERGTVDDVYDAWLRLGPDHRAVIAAVAPELGDALAAMVDDISPGNGAIDPGSLAHRIVVATFEGGPEYLRPHRVQVVAHGTRIIWPPAERAIGRDDHGRVCEWTWRHTEDGHYVLGETTPLTAPDVSGA